MYTIFPQMYIDIVKGIEMRHGISVGCVIIWACSAKLVAIVALKSLSNFFACISVCLMLRLNYETIIKAAVTWKTAYSSY